MLTWDPCYRVAALVGDQGVGGGCCIGEKSSDGGSVTRGGQILLPNHISIAGGAGPLWAGVARIKRDVFSQTTPSPRAARVAGKRPHARPINGVIRARVTCAPPRACPPLLHGAPGAEGRAARRVGGRALTMAAARGNQQAR